MKVMEINLKKHLRVFFQLKKLGFMKKAIYRADFVVLLVAVLIQVALSVYFIKIVYSYVNDIAGWSYPETLLAVANYMIIDGILWMLFGQVRGIMNHIRYGTFDGILIKPINSQFLTSVWEGDLEDGVRIIIGVAVIVYALNQLNLSIESILVNGIFYIILLINATLIAYSFMLVIRSISFWVINGYALFNLSEALLRVTQYPTDIFYHSIVRTFFTVLLPLAFIATVPAKVLARGFDWQLVLGSCAMALIFFTLSRKFWLFALKHYQSASS